MFKEGSDIEYELDLPPDYVQMTNIKGIFRLIPGRTTKTVDDYEIRTDMLLYMLNPITLEFYPIRLHPLKDRVKLEKYCNDGNLFMNKNDMIWDKDH